MEKLLPFKIVATLAFALFGALSSLAVWDLGFGWQGILAVVAVVAVFLYELWFVSYSYTQYTKGVLQTIQGFRGEDIKLPQNIADAKDLVAMLKDDREILAEAYVSLYKENKALKEDKDKDDSE